MTLQATFNDTRTINEFVNKIVDYVQNVRRFSTLIGLSLIRNSYENLPSLHFCSAESVDPQDPQHNCNNTGVGGSSYGNSSKMSVTKE